ncbi:MAG: RNA-binding cell elongation regulator Jag/EloR [Candidatus Limiplasma sp.]|nr:RNA-binding cell elongation regulator Jag/EloR [Candidatus Limiplasma sp.]MEA5146478.1 RNA-binding cell elongation regulator Jag/EloR [Candidatus Limiplasma sp.]
MRSIESSAKTMEEAVTQGLEKLGVSLGDVSIDIIDEGSKGFFGLIGGKPARVRLTVKEGADDTNLLASLSLGSDSPVKEQPKSKPEAARAEAKPTRTEKAKQAKPNAQSASKEKPAKPVRQARTDAAPKAAKTTPASLQDAESAAGKAQRFLIEVTRLMNVDVTVDAGVDSEGNVRVDIHGDTLGILIGRRGETLDAIQYLTSLAVNRGQETYTRVTIDTENYRAKREEALTRLANRMANRAVKTGRKVVLEPMNPYERRILHSALQQNDAVTTHSEGDEPNRHVVITLK